MSPAAEIAAISVEISAISPKVAPPKLASRLKIRVGSVSIPAGMPRIAGMPKLPIPETKAIAPAGDQPRSAERQHDIAKHPERAGAGKPCRLDAVARARRKPGFQRQEDERRVLHAEQKRDTGKRIERLRAAERRRQPERLQERARRPRHLHPGQRRHLRRDHHRQHEGEAQSQLAPDVGECHREGEE